MGASQWDKVNFYKNKVWYICMRLVATGFHGYLNFFEIGALRVLQTNSSIVHVHANVRVHVGWCYLVAEFL